MTKEELLKILTQTSGDPEHDHSAQDEALLEYIDDPEITAAFNSGTKWYA